MRLLPTVEFATEVHMLYREIGKWFSMFRKSPTWEGAEFVAILSDKPAEDPEEVFQRSEAAKALGALGPAAWPALPALLQTLIVPVQCDCGLVLRVAAAAAICRIGMIKHEALPVLAWALKDEYWGVVPDAVEVLTEVGEPFVVPDLIWLAERRLGHGPFDFERWPRSTTNEEPEPLLAAVARALGKCGRGQSGLYAAEVKVMLATLAKSEDDRVQAAAEDGLAQLADY